MVSYQTWTSVVFDVVKSHGGEFDSIDDGAEVVEIVADIWRDRADELKTATKAEARNIALQEIEVR